jgi:hypothetical protein
MFKCAIADEDVA